MRGFAILLAVGVIASPILISLLDGGEPPPLASESARVALPGQPAPPGARRGDTVTDSQRSGGDGPGNSGNRMAAAPDESRSAAGLIDAAASRPSARTGSLQVTVRKNGRFCPAVVRLHRFRAGVEPGELWLWRATVPLPPMAREAACGVDGRATFDAVPEGNFVIVARSGTDAGWQWIWVAAAGTTNVALDIDCGTRSLRGRVLLGDRPFRGWVVLMEGRDTVVPNGVPRRTDGHGRFAFSGVKKDKVSLMAYQEGTLLARSAPIDLGRTDEVVFDVQAGARTYTGVVVEQPGRIPVAGATVEVDFASTFIWGSREKTDARGEFRFLAASRTEDLKAVAPGLETSFVEWNEGPERVVIWVRRRGTVAGHLVRPDGNPAAGITVWGLPVSGRRVDGERSRHTVSDSSGGYRLDGLPQGDVFVVALGNGWATAGLSGLALDRFNPHILSIASAEPTAHDIEVEKAGRVVGRVMDSAGNPVPGAWVGAVIDGDLGDELWPERKADEKGRFAIENVPAGRADVYVRSGNRRRTSVGVTVSAGATTSAELRLSRADKNREVLIRVVDPRGRPIPDAMVTEWGPQWSRADGDGRVLLSTPTREGLRVEVWADGALSLKGVPVADGAADQTIVMAAGVCLRGSVQFADGRPAAGASVEVAPADKNRLPRYSLDKWYCTAAMDGRFEVRVPDVACELTASLDHGRRRYSAWVGLADPRSGAKLVLESEEEEPEGVVVNVVGPDGLPVSRGHVSYQGIGSEGIESQGSGQIRGGELRAYLSPQCDRWTFMVHHAIGHRGFPLGAYHGAVFSDRFSAPEIRLPPEQSISGVVCDERGVGIQGCALEAWALLPGFDWDSDEYFLHGRARTDGEGRFRIGGLGQIRYRLIVRQVPPGRRLPDPEAVVAPAKDVVIRAEPGLECRLTFLDWRGRPVSGVRVSAEESPQRHPDGEVGATTDGKGIAVLRGINPERRFYLDAYAPYRDDLFSVSIEKWRPADQTIQMEHALTVKGRIVDEQESVVSDGAVWIQEAEDWHEHEADSEGHFKIRALPAGPVCLRATYRGESALDGVETEKTVMAGTGDVLFKLPPSRTVSITITGWPQRARRADGRLLWHRPDGTQGFDWEWCSKQEKLVFRHVRPDRKYDVWIHAHDACWWERDRSFIGSEVSIALQPGKSIRGRLAPPAAGRAASAASVFCEMGTVWVHGEVDESGDFEILGLPEGVWTVHGEMKIGGKKHAGVAKVRAGATCTLTLAPVAE